MGKVVAVASACAASTLVAPAIAGTLGMEATAGFDAADLFGILFGLAVFFIVFYITGFF